MKINQIIVNESNLNNSIEEGETWSKHNNPRAGGMSKKSVKSYRRSHPGSKIQTAVTTKPSKLKKGSKSAKRRKSFCARMRGMKKHRTGAKTARDPNSNINKSLRRWHCESIEQMQELIMIAEQKINEAKNWKQQAAIAIAKKNKLNEFAPSDGGDGPDEDEILYNLAKQWWLGSEKDMIRAERTLASMGWEIGEDEGSYDNGGVFVVRAGDEHGKSYQSWPHEELVDEGQTSDMRSFFSTQQPLNPAPAIPTTGSSGGPTIASVTRQGESMAEEGKGLWANIHAKRERIKNGSGEHMRKPGSKGAPSKDALKKATTEGVAEGKGDYVPPKEADYGDDYQSMVKRVGQKAKQQELAKKKQEKSKDLDESTNQLNKILKLSGHTK